MKKYVFTSILCAAIAAGCSTQRASDTNNNSQPANNQPAAQSQTTTEEQQRQQEQEKANSTGQKIGEKAREAEVRTRDERQKIKEGAADATEKIKKGAKVAAEDLKAAAAGIREGWTKSEQIDANNASQADLERAGLSKAEAQTVISHRPYRSKDDLKAVLTASSYEKVDGKIVIK